MQGIVDATGEAFFLGAEAVFAGEGHEQMLVEAGNAAGSEDAINDLFDSDLGGDCCLHGGLPENHTFIFSDFAVVVGDGSDTLSVIVLGSASDQRFYGQ